MKNSEIKRNLDYIKTKIIIELKTLNEYKINFYYAFIFGTFLIFGLAIFMNVIYNNFQDLNDWSFNQYFFYIFFFSSLNWLSGTFWVNSKLEQDLLSGELNVYLTKPISIFIQYFFSSLALMSFFTGIIYFIILFLFVVYLKLNLFIFFKVWIFSTLGIILFISILRFFDSLAFFIKKNQPYKNIFMNISGMYERFPLNFSGNLKYLSYLFPVVLYGYYGTQYMFNQLNFDNLLFLIYLQIILISVFVIFSLLLWYYGLKKYEAFG